MASPLCLSSVVAATTDVKYTDELVLNDVGNSPRTHINFEVSNAAATAVNAFVLQLKDHKDGAFYNYLSGADWATATSNMLFASATSPAAVGAGGKANAHVRVGAAYSCRFGLSLASSTGNVTVRASAQGN